MVATDSLCLSAIFFNSGSEWRGESGVSTRRSWPTSEGVVRTYW
jgi:hypothetical protein